MEEFTEINVTPFTDVLLVLLIIFMVLAALVAPVGFERQFACHCGSPSTAAHLQRAQLAVQQNGRMSLDGSAVDQKSIYAALQRLHSAHHRIGLDILAGSRVPYALIIRVMDAAKDAQITDVALLTM